MNWEEPGSMQEYCCGDDLGEWYATSSIFGLTYHACCNESTDCVDNESNCQIGREETYALCLDGLDNDCDGLIDGDDTNCTGIVEGYVFDQYNQPLGGATVKASPPALASEYEKTSSPTLPNGFYSFNPLVGNYSFIARKEGFDDNVTFLIIHSGITKQVNFTLKNGSCHYDCTDYYGNCNPACNGTEFGGGENCTIISPLCYNRPEGFLVRYINQTTNMIHEYKCCEGPARAYPVMKAKVKGAVPDLYDLTLRNIKIEGTRGTMHILTWFNKTE
jgi:hypothetical protein